MTKILTLFLICVLSVLHSFAQTDNEFWFVAPNVDANGANFNIPIVLRMTSVASTASVTISIPADPTFAPIVVSIPAGSTQTVDLSAWVNQLQSAPPDVVQNKGILIQSTTNITAYYEVVSSYCSCNPEVFSLKGKNALGNEFYISSQYTYNIDTIRQPAATTSFDIVATEDNTTVTVTPSQDIVGHSANIPFSFVLNRGQTYSATGVYRDLNHHLQGSYIVSGKPIAITLKDDLVFGDGTCADLIGDQTIPTTVLGNEYIVSKGFLVPQDRVFVLAAQDNTPIFLDGNSSASIVLNKGQSWTFNLSNPNAYINSDKKFYVYHVTGNGCELGSAIIPKLNCTGSTNVSIVRSSNDDFGVMLITKTGNQGSFTVNGNAAIISPSSFNVVPGTAGVYVAATVDLSGYLPAGSVLNFSNSSGRFEMGFLNGAAIGGSRYGFFSDYKASNVTSSQVEICRHDSAQLNAFGGVAYAWSPSTGLSDTTLAAPKASPAVTTTYKAVITDIDGCIDSAFVNVVIDTASPPDYSFDQSVCNPLQVKFSGLSQSGNSYNWDVNGTLYSSGQEITTIFSQPGSYPVKLKVTQFNGCQDSLTKIIPVLLQPANIISGSDTVVCTGKGITLQTQPTLDFCWSPTTYLDNPASPNPIASPPVTTKYYFTAKTTGTNLIVNGNFESGNTGFSSAYTYSNSGLPEGVYVVGASPHDWNSNAPLSCGDHTSGSGNMMIVNGNPVANINVWSSGTFTVTPNTNYAFSIWIQSISPYSPAILQFSINGAALGDAVNASANTCSWNQFYTSWNSGSSTTATISLVNNNTATTGNDFALDDISFAPVSLQIDSVTINVETPLVTATPADTSICPGMPVPLHASGSLNYTWSPATDLSDPAIAGPVVLMPVADAGTTTVYTVTGVSARGCIADTTVSITQYPRLLSIGPDTLICRGDPAQLHASGGGSGGGGYSWSPVAGLDDPASATPIARPAVTTRYILVLTDPNRCIEQDSVTVSVKAVPVFHAPPDEEVCVGFGVALKSGNAAGYIYDWSPATGLDRPSAPDPMASPGASTRYTLHISDSLCSAYDSSFTVAVTVNPSPVISVEKDNDIDCSVHTAQLRVSGAASYVWTPASALSNAFSADPVASIDNTTTFIVKGTSLNGCYAYDSLTVLVTATGDNTFVVPNAFTPNGDGHNDCWGVTRWGDVQLQELVIFNRWGQRVFNTRNPSDCWDGTYGGKPQPAGAYPYVIQAHSFCGVIMKTGIVMLIR